MNDDVPPSEEESPPGLAEDLPPPPDDDLPPPPSEDEEYPALAKTKPGEMQQPFRCLGYDQGRYFYLPDSGQQIIELSPTEHKKLNLYQLAPSAYFEWRWSGDFDLAAEELMRLCREARIFDPRQIRGRGCWMDAGRVVFHAGRHLFVTTPPGPPVQMEVDKFETKYIYEQGRPIECDLAKRATANDGKNLLKICQMLNWRKKMTPTLFAGWCFVAPLCGVLAWRPNVWISGQSKSGKTWTIDNIVRPLLGKNCFDFLGSTTEAAIRQTIRSDALPVIFDEAEALDEIGHARVQKILEFMRACTSDGAPVVKGSSHGTASVFEARSCFCLASIGVAAIQQADVSRIIGLEMTKLEGDAGPAHFEELSAAWGDVFLRENFCESIRCRALSLAPMIAKNATTFKKFVSRRLKDSRAGDLIGTLLAGAYGLVSDSEICADKAEDWINKQEWDDYENNAAVDGDERKTFAMLCEAHVRVEGGITSVGQLVNQYYDGTEDTKARAYQLLGLHGLRPIVTADGEHMVAVSNSSTWLKRIFANTAWADKWRDQFLRLKGARPCALCHIAPGVSTRAVYIPKWEFLHVD